MTQDALTPGADGFTLRVRLTPNAAQNVIEGKGEDASGQRFLKCRVRAVPEKGKANAALIKLLARALSAPRSAITLESGQTARLKTLRIDDPEALPRARTLLEGSSP